MLVDVVFMRRIKILFRKIKWKIYLLSDICEWWGSGNYVDYCIVLESIVSIIERCIGILIIYIYLVFIVLVGYGVVFIFF